MVRALISEQYPCQDFSSLVPQIHNETTGYTRLLVSAGSAEPDDSCCADKDKHCLMSKRHHQQRGLIRRDFQMMRIS